jgi:hypothetical protein
MKIKFLITAGVLAMLASVSAKATTTYNNGDFFLDVRDLSGSTSYLIDLGQGFNFGTSFDIPISGLTTDLNAVVGTGWATDANAVFSIVGGTTAGATSELLYATAPGATWNTSRTGEAPFGNAVVSIEGSYANNPTNSTSGNSQVWIEGNTDNNSYVSYANAGFGYFASPVEGAITSSLNFDYLPAGSTHAGTVEGSFALDGANNSLDFTSAAVPEPSTYAAVIMGAAALVAARFRRRA